MAWTVANLSPQGLGFHPRPVEKVALGQYFFQVLWSSHQHNSTNNPYSFIILSITNKMQRYTVFFITVNFLHVSGGFSAHHQELKTVRTASGICQACLLLQLVWVELAHASCYR